MIEYSVYFVATPIGNLDEITFRAVEILKSVDTIFCEDTRHAKILLNRYDITKPLTAYHKFNEKSAVQNILDDVNNGKKIAVITDAGMPCISDPGNVLVNELNAKKISYTVISGACALVNAFVLSGFSAPFTFVGFLPEKNIDRQRLMETLPKKQVLIFYSSVHDVGDDLKYLYSVLGERKVCVAREISKMYESVYFGNLKDIEIDVTKGEFVIVVDADKNNEFIDMSIEEHINFYISQGFSKNEAVKKTAKDRKVNKNEIYQIALDMSSNEKK
ncbi:MAG TPA: 16S rRNA (cytidine(1402)-2'-O)-methyltransferase [Clostridia bacterium]|nr:16S rRNA (cytidine(1402)-2'-O)-methyltransferase [Clostridia bacterium]